MNYTLRDISSNATPNGVQPGNLPVHYDLYIVGSEHSKAIRKDGQPSKGTLGNGSWNAVARTPIEHGKRADKLFSYYPQGIKYGATGLFMPSLSNIIVSVHPAIQIGFDDKKDASELAHAIKEHYNHIRSEGLRGDYKSVVTEFLGDDGFEKLENKIKTHMKNYKQPITLQNKRLAEIRSANPQAYEQLTTLINQYHKSIN